MVYFSPKATKSRVNWGTPDFVFFGLEWTILKQICFHKDSKVSRMIIQFEYFHFLTTRQNGKLLRSDKWTKNMVGKIWVGMYTINIHLIQFKILAVTCKNRTLNASWIHQNSLQRKKKNTNFYHYICHLAFFSPKCFN